MPADRRLLALVCAAAVAVGTPPTVAAQAVAAPTRVTQSDTAPRPRWFAARDAWTLGAFALSAAAVAPFDQHFAHEFQRPSLHRNHTVVHLASAIRATGDPGTLVFSMGLYAFGRAIRHEGVADVGLHTAEAVLVSGATTGILKGLVGRARPYIVADSDAAVFHPLTRRGGYASFPSGHTTVAFAAAASLSEEFARSDAAARHPQWANVVPPLLYGSAALVGLSRMYHDAHWGSDVVAAAGIGTVAGRLFVRAQHAGPRSRVDRWLLPLSVAPTRSGTALTWRAPF